MARKVGSGDYPVMQNGFYISDEMNSVIQYFIDKYNMNRSSACRHIMDNGIQYMAIFGDGINVQE